MKIDVFRDGSRWLQAQDTTNTAMWTKVKRNATAGRVLKIQPTKPAPPPAPTGLTLQRTIFWANVDDSAVQYACRLGTSWRHALTADPAYTPTTAQVNALKAAGGGVDAWGNQNQIPYSVIDGFHDHWGLDRAILQAETQDEFESAWPWSHYIIGNPNAWTTVQRDHATVLILHNELEVTGEVYNGRPDTYSSQGVPISSLTLGVAMDNGLRYPLTDLLTKTPAGAKNTICVWHGSGLLPEDWAALQTLGGTA